VVSRGQTVPHVLHARGPLSVDERCGLREEHGYATVSTVTPLSALRVFGTPPRAVAVVWYASG
jgi:hypothetical protein